MACGGGGGNPDAAPNPDAAATPDAQANPDADPTPDADETPDADLTPDADDTDAACPSCDADDDGVIDENDECADTPAATEVNDEGCSDAQVDAVLQTSWPPYSLDWTPAGQMGLAGGMTWTYANIEPGDLFHIYWLPCDDPISKCGLSLDGPIDDPDEYWVFSAADSDLPGGKLVFTNTTQIFDPSSNPVPLTGRMTLTFVDALDATIAVQTVAALGVTARDATHGVEITGTGFEVTVLAEVKEAAGAYTPYQQYFDSAPKQDPHPSLTVSFGGSFYDE
jgi:hypothetical protein